MKTLVKILKSFLLNLLIFTGSAVSQQNNWTHVEAVKSGFPVFNQAVSIVAAGDYSYVTGVKSEPNGNAYIVTELLDRNGSVIATTKSLTVKQTVPFTNAPVSISTSPSGHVYVCGSEYLNDFWGYEGVIIKYDAYLNEKWRIYTYLSPGYADEIKDFVIDRSGNLIVAGLMKGEAGGSRIFINKYNQDGNLEFAFKPGFGNERLTDVCKLLSDQEGNIYAGGTSNSKNKGKRMFALQLNKSGQFVWLKFTDASNEALDDVAHTMCFDKAGNICLAGSTEIRPGVWNSFIAKLDQFGQLVSKKSFGTQVSTREGIWKVLSANDSCLFAISYSSGSKAGSPKIVIYKLSPSCNQKLITTKEGVIVDAVIAKSGCLWIAGSDNNRGGFINKLCPNSTKTLFSYYGSGKSAIKGKNSGVAFHQLAAGDNNEIYACGHSERIAQDGGLNSVWLVEKFDDEFQQNNQELGVFVKPE